MAYLESTSIHYIGNIFCKPVDVFVRSSPLGPLCLPDPVAKRKRTPTISHVCSLAAVLLECGVSCFLLLPDFVSIRVPLPRCIPATFPFLYLEP